MARKEEPSGFRPIEVPVRVDPHFKPIEVQFVTQAAPVAEPKKAAPKPATGTKED